MKAAEISVALSHSDAEVRRQAVLEMPGIRDPGLGPQLLRALGDHDWRVRAEAIRVGSEIAEPLGLLPELLLAARQLDDVGLRGAALEVMVRGGDVALNTLISALPLLEPNERQRALEVLARSGNRRAVQALDVAVFGTDPSVIDALAELGGPEAEAALRRRLSASDAFVRVAALDALNRLDAAVPFDELSRLLDDRMTTRMVLRAMGRSGGLQVIDPLLNALTGPTALATTAVAALERCTRNPTQRGELVRKLAVSTEALRTSLRKLTQRNEEGVALGALKLLALARDVSTTGAALEMLTRGIAAQRIAVVLVELGWDAVQTLNAPKGATVSAPMQELQRELTQELRARREPAPPQIAAAAQRAISALDDHEGARVERIAVQTPMPKLMAGDFPDLSAMIRGASGIHLGEDARHLVERKIGERITALGLGSFSDYRKYLRRDVEGSIELERAIDMIAVHETYFFREPTQLLAFQKEVLPELHSLALTRRALTLWSAGCSSGEEAYTLAMLVTHSPSFAGWTINVVGNDISRRVVQTARKGVYRGASFRAMPAEYQHHFIEVPEGRQVEASIRGMCHFARLNLLDGSRGSMVGRVDAIFCRNLLIYFDEAARRELISIFYDRLLPGGYLMLGHSESLLHLTTAFELVQLSSDLVYRKPLSASAKAGQ